MSAELHVFLPARVAPSTRDWQAAITALGLDVRLDPALDLARASGHTRVRVRGSVTGFELKLDDAAAIVREYPGVATRVAGCDRAVTLRWGGDLLECAAALGAAAGLVRGFGATAYFPDDDAIQDADDLVAEFEACSE